MFICIQCSDNTNWKQSLSNRCNLPFIVKENFYPESTQSEQVKKTQEEENYTR